LSLAPQADAADPDPIVLRSRVFDIPFHIDGSSAARAVKLYVSTDRGQSWRVADEQTLPVTGFHIEATEDGEHWFAHATDLDDITDPAGQLTAERKILIDSLGPAIKLGGEADLEGTFAGRVTLSDRHGIASLRILYATDVDRQWISVANESVDGEGRFQIRPDSDWRQMSVHVTATDSIGNVSVEARTFRRPRIAAKENQLRIRPVAGPSDPPSFMLGPKPFADRSPDATDRPAPAGPAQSPPYAESRSSSETSPPAGANAFRGLGTFGSAFGPSADNRTQRRTARPSPISTGSPSASGMPPAATENSPADAAGDAATPEAATTGLATLPAAGLAAKVTPEGVEVLETPPPDPAEPAAASET